MNIQFHRALLLIAIILLTVQLSFTQDDIIEHDDSADLGMLTKHFTSKADPIYTIELTTSGPNDSFVWSYCTSADSNTCGTYLLESDCGTCEIPEESNSSNTLRVTFSGQRITIGHPAAGLPSPGVYHFRLRLTSSDFLPSPKEKYYKFVVRDPIKMTFVVDRSGSMECIPDSPIATNDWAACADISQANRKWNLVRDGIGAFLAPLIDNPLTQLPDEDVFSIVYFDGDIINPSAVPSPIVDDDTSTSTPNFLNLTNFANNITADFNAFANISGAGRNGTGLGSALKYNMDNKDAGSISSNFRQVVVVITDGQENRSPKVNSNGLGLDNGISLLNNDTPPNTNFIEYFVLAMDAPNAHSNSYGDKLQNLSTGGTTMSNFVDVPSSTNTTQAINHLITSIYAGHSPQIVDEVALNFINDTIEYSFPVNKYVSQLYFSASFENQLAESFYYRIEKEGVDDVLLSRQTPQFFGNTALLLVDINRFRENGDSVNGNWKLIISRQLVLTDDGTSILVDPLENFHIFNSPITDQSGLRTSNDVTLSCVVDDGLVDIEYDFGTSNFKVGDDLESSLRLTIEGQPFDSADITVKLTRPGADKGDLIAKAKVNHIPSSPNSEISNPFTVKYAEMVEQSPDSLLVLALESDTKNLISQGSGFYKTRFSNLNVADSYGLEFVIKANHPILGEILRYKRISTVVRFGTLIHELGEQAISTDPRDGIFIHTLTYIPTYEVNGESRLVGPGYEDAFTLNASDDVQLTNVTDNGDGSYTLTVRSNGRNPEVDFYLVDEPFYVDKPIQEFGGPIVDTTYSKHFSIHSGVTLPLNGLDLLYSGSFFVEGDIGFLLKPRLDLEFIAGYYDFTPDYNIIGVSANLRYNMLQLGSTSGLDVTVAGGVGIYKPSDIDATVGLNARVGLQKQINPNISASLETAYYLLPSPNYSWATIGAVLRYGF